MANRSKAKGDQAERDAVAMLVDRVPHLVVAKPERMLGAGRKDDVGDLRVFPDVAVQVRCYKLSTLSLGLRTAAVDAAAQAVNGDMAHHLGLVPYPGARQVSVRWLATATTWPIPVTPRDFGTAVSTALAWVRDDVGPKPKKGARKALPPPPHRTERIALIHGRGAAPYLLAPVEAWLAAYAHTRGATPTHETPNAQEVAA